ncbi:Protein of unknown function [Gryllus bimaculatus]|nr:Protein of unknown function [Gryllus bimaculatus]
MSGTDNNCSPITSQPPHRRSDAFSIEKLLASIPSTGGRQFAPSHGCYDGAGAAPATTDADDATRAAAAAAAAVRERTSIATADSSSEVALDTGAAALNASDLPGVVSTSEEGVDPVHQLCTGHPASSSPSALLAFPLSALWRRLVSLPVGGLGPCPGPLSGRGLRAAWVPRPLCGLRVLPRNARRPSPDRPRPGGFCRAPPADIGPGGARAGRRVRP